ncbi:hypothetical protein BDV26DRAFT_197533 [Aspergillus bertholletiae]|uniref:Uncharacterized protein n=1 Tax=Aspergillus bertholletiae TaxID=1226010 RepID=A0A5N7B8T3_9EURO|nr:hypothetical protein BDV26DRAFT_197533 [Aspergillus bertholletiae]
MVKCELPVVTKLSCWALLFRRLLSRWACFGLGLHVPSLIPNSSTPTTTTSITINIITTSCSLRHVSNVYTWQIKPFPLTKRDTAGFLSTIKELGKAVSCVRCTTMKFCSSLSRYVDM